MRLPDPGNRVLSQGSEVLVRQLKFTEMQVVLILKEANTDQPINEI